MVLTIYNACAYSYYHKTKDGKYLDAWCPLFKYEDFEVN